MPGQPEDPLPLLPDTAFQLYPSAMPNAPEGAMEKLDAKLLDDSRRITDPGERALALYRTAKAKIFAHEFQDAHIALVEAGEAVMQVPPGLIRDLRLRGIASTLLDLAHEQVQEGMLKDLGTGEVDRRALRALDERMASLRGAEDEWKRAARLAATIQNHNFRSEQLYRVVDSEAIESQTIGHTIQQATPEYNLQLLPKVYDVKEIPAEGKDLVIVAAVGQALHFRIFDDGGHKVVETDEATLKEQTPKDEESQAELGRRIEGLKKTLEPLWPPHVSTPAEKVQIIFAVLPLVGHLPTVTRYDLWGQGQGLLDFADRALVNAQAHADLITRPVWRDRALLEVTGKAAYSDQFPRALEIARTIPDPEIRTDALVRVAEGLARRNYGPPATQVYAEAAQAVSEVPDDDIRGVIAGVLIDSLIATGRFDDARRCVVLMPDVTRQIVALGAVAESQGKRFLSDRARQWIDREAPPEYRAMLRRKVEDGELSAFDLLKTQSLTTGAARTR
jgi:hypothetical protein